MLVGEQLALGEGVSILTPLGHMLEFRCTEVLRIQNSP